MPRACRRQHRTRGHLHLPCWFGRPHAETMDDGSLEDTTPEEEGAHHQGSVRRKIFRHSVLVAVGGAFILLAAFIATTFHGLPDWVDAVKGDMTKEELSSLGRLASDKAIFTTEVLKQTQVDLSLVAVFALAAIRTTTAAPANRNFKTFSGIEAQGFPTTTNSANQVSYDNAGLQEQDYVYKYEAQLAPAYQQSSKHSTLLLPEHRNPSVSGYRTSAALSSLPSHTKELLDKIAGVDLVYRSLKGSGYGSNGALLYIGLEDHQPSENPALPAEHATYKVFPGENMEGYKGKYKNGVWTNWGVGRTCDPRWQGSWATTGRNTAGGLKHYDPRCRSWYQDARQAGRMIFTAPYNDAVGGKLVIGAAVPLYNTAGHFKGVAAIDFAVDSLDKSILNSKILDGYGFLMAVQETPAPHSAKGTAVIHKKLDRSGSPPTVAQLEGLVGNEKFEDAELRMRMGCTGTAKYMRSDADGDKQQWLLSFAAETAVGAANCSVPADWSQTIGYSVGLTVSEAALLQPFDELETSIRGLIGVAILVICVSVGGGLVLMISIANVRCDTPLHSIENFVAGYYMPCMHCIPHSCP
jgi:hypothetical protein